MIAAAAGFRRPPARQFTQPREERRRAQRKANPAPVRRWSIEKGKEGDLFRPMRRELRGLMRDFYDELQVWGRRPDANWGLLTGKTRLVLHAMMERVNWATGRLDPSWLDLMTLAGCCKKTLARALDLLEALGLLRRQRRCDRTKEGWRQTSNGYALTFPRELVREFGRRFLRLLDIHKVEEGPGCDAWSASRREPRSEMDLTPHRTAQAERLAKAMERKRVSAAEARFGRQSPATAQGAPAFPTMAETKAARRALYEAHPDFPRPESRS